MDAGLAMRMIDTWAAQNRLAIQIDYRDINLAPKETREIPATDEFWAVEFADAGVRIQSDWGYYDRHSEQVSDNKNTHTGMIRIENTTNQVQNLTFIVGIAV